MRLLFSLATFVGSFALFLLEPMVAKALLPNFGGSSLVWNVSLLFFQAALLAGYAYANALSTRLDPRKATPIHGLALLAAVILCAVAFVPVKLWQVHPAAGATPLMPLLVTLTLTTAAPFVALAAGTPLLQRWFAHSSDAQAHDPYFLYAASNLGSFCGLISYPTLVEPHLALGQQRQFVLLLIAVYSALLLAAAYRLRRQTAGIEHAEPTAEPAQVNWADRGKWLALSAGPSALLLAVTSDLTKNIAPIPLLWVVPLGLYLLTFVIVFSKRARRLEAAGGAPLWLRLGLALALAADTYLTFNPAGKIVIALPIAVTGFFAVALACHLQLARLRPPAAQLTEYYLWVSIGGVVGGAFCAVIAPLVFNGLTELPVSFGVCVALYGFVQYRRGNLLRDGIVSGLGLAAVVALWWFWNGHVELTWQMSVMLGAAFVALSVWPARFALLYLGYLGLFAFLDKHPAEQVLFTHRNYYGFETVVAETDPPRHRLINGNITHGSQYLDPPLNREPTTYYAKTGPLGEALLPTLDSHPNARIGAVGLGTGTEAAYGRPGMIIDFYELNPTVPRIATDPKLFTYVRDSKAKIHIILGDARLSLVDAPTGGYDAIILDAFSSDSIPVHLLTKEAFEIDASKLKPDGIILVHTSNRYLALAKFVAATAASVGLQSDLAVDGATDMLRWPTTWLCLARSRRRLRAIEGLNSFWAPYSAPQGTKGWTDDYSNVFGALKIFNP